MLKLITLISFKYKKLSFEIISGSSIVVLCGLAKPVTRVRAPATAYYFFRVVTNRKIYKYWINTSDYGININIGRWKLERSNVD